MLGNLNNKEIENLIQQQYVGHLACHADDSTYVVPISYAYDGEYIYFISKEGQKVDMVRKNPRVCFQIDELKDMANWKSVVVWGECEELPNDGNRKKAIETLLKRSLPISSSVTTHLGAYWPFAPEDTKEIAGIVFRIKIRTKTGRFESTGESPYFPG